ncbi:hypothetical protein [Pedobacter psychrophilus]|nr:hypothetical protein [Pedobacter psychrophilus]
MNDKDVDELLKKISSSNEYIMPEEKRSSIIYLMTELKLIYKPYDNSLIFAPTKFGNEVINEGGWIKHLEIEKESLKLKSEREILDFEKSKTDLELAKKLLKEYPYTKWFARISLFIGIGLGLLELIKYIKQS